MPAQLTSPPPQPAELPSLCLSLIEHSPLPMATVDGATHVVHYVNPAFSRLLNKPREDLIGKALSEMLPKKDDCVSLLDRVFLTGKAENHLKQEETKTPPVFWSYTVWPVPSNERMMVVMIQVTDTAQLHKTTLAMNEALMLGSIRQHELTEAADASNARLQEEIIERRLIEKA